MDTRILRAGLDFGEAPRWRDGRLYYSDFYRGAVFSLGLDGREEKVVDVPEQPSGLGWLPDGRMLVVSMRDRELLRREPDGRLVTHADLSALATFHCNDLLVDDAGRAYVGNFGFDLHAMMEEDEVPAVVAKIHADPDRFSAVLARVDPDGRTVAAADGLLFPNGMALLDGGRTLVVAETVAFRLTAYERAEDGTLSGRRLWAQLEGAAPDGICLGPDGTLFVATALLPEVWQVAPGGRVVRKLRCGAVSFAVATDDALEHLFVMTAPSSDPREVQGARRGAVELAVLA